LSKFGFFTEIRFAKISIFFTDILFAKISILLPTFAKFTVPYRKLFSTSQIRAVACLEIQIIRHNSLAAGCLETKVVRLETLEVQTLLEIQTRPLPYLETQIKISNQPAYLEIPIPTIQGMGLYLLRNNGYSV